MKIPLPLGSWIEYRYRNRLEVAQVGMFGTELSITVGRTPTTGTTIHRGVWKKNEFHVRKTYTL